MPTIIDSLVVELGLDPSKFTKGQQETLEKFKKLQDEASKGAKATEEQTRRLVNAVEVVKREAVGLLSAFVGGRGLKEFVGYITNFDAAAGRSARTLNISTRELSRWQGVAQQTGGTAEGITASLQGLTDQVNRFLLTGEGNFLPIFNALNISLYDTNGKLKNSGELFLDLSRAVEKLDPARARAILSGLGIDANTINALLLGRDALQKLIDAQKQLGEITEEDAAAAQKLQQAWAETEKAAISLGRTITTKLTEPMVGFLNRWRDIFSELSKGYIISPNSVLGKIFGLQYKPGDKPSETAPILDAARAVANAGSIEVHGPVSLAGRIGETLARAAGFLGSEASSIGSHHGAHGHRGGHRSLSNSGAPSPTDIEAYIREAASARGIDPDIAVRVAKSEGLYAYGHSPSGQSFVPGEQSFGPFQLWYGSTGLGTKFTRQTGLNARDASTWQRQVDFALDEARKGGWGPWHGWKGAPFAGITPGALAGDERRGVGRHEAHGHKTSIQVGTVVLHTRATDGAGAAEEFASALKRMSTTTQANYAQQ
jgi:hypothetical protein